MSSPLDNQDRAARNLYKRLHSCDRCREPLSLYDQLSGPCPRCGAQHQVGLDLTLDAARALLIELQARRRELGLSDQP
jgi:uncharacterized paraquat-inducible protein A